MSLCLLCHDSFHTTFTLRRCKHVICTKCMVNYLEDISSAKVKCPVKECIQNITDAIIRECLSNNLLQLYDRLSQPTNIFKCLIKKCPFVLSFDSTENAFLCPICHQPNCLLCNTMHYPKEACFTGNQKKYEEAALKYIKNIERAEMEFYDETYQLTPNPESFDCPICFLFILPRKGVILRNCLHSFCRDCLFSTFCDSNYLNQLICSACSAPLKEKECLALLGNEKNSTLSLNALRTKFFNCKEPNCNAIWDIGDFKGKYRCPKCKKENCISCEYVHEGISCEQFRETDSFKGTKIFQKKLNKENGVACTNCTRWLIKKKGCGALKCDKCNTDVCAFTGKLVGKGGCGCTSEKPCHKDCKFGCIPE